MLVGVVWRKFGTLEIVVDNFAVHNQTKKISHILHTLVRIDPYLDTVFRTPLRQTHLSKYELLHAYPAPLGITV